MKAVEARHLLRIDYHTPYVQLECRDIENVIDEARGTSLRVYRGKKHITISNGVYSAR